MNGHLTLNILQSINAIENVLYIGYVVLIFFYQYAHMLNIFLCNSYTQTRFVDSMNKLIDCISQRRISRSVHPTILIDPKRIAICAIYLVRIIGITFIHIGKFLLICNNPTANRLLLERFPNINNFLCSLSLILFNVFLNGCIRYGIYFLYFLAVYLNNRNCVDVIVC